MNVLQFGSLESVRNSDRHGDEGTPLAAAHECTEIAALASSFRPAA
jgi:hypothetical protein